MLTTGTATTLVLVIISSIHSTTSQHLNPSILQDTRNLPKVDGTFGFLYRTEDGISHAAKGDSNGMIHGSFSYTDPTGLKVNYNYNAGSRVAPGYNYEPIQAAPKYSNNPAPISRYTVPEPYYDQNYQELPQEPAPQPQYRERERTRPQYRARPRSRSPSRHSEDVYQQRRARPVPRENDLYEDYNYRY